MPSHWTKYFQIFFLGIFTSITQILLSREFYSTFSGNELSIGILLAFWLLGSGIGNLISKKYIKNFYKTFKYLFFFNLLYFLLILLVLRRFRLLFNFSPGEIINIFYILLFSIFFIFPYCLIWGISFATLFFLLKEENVKYPESKIYFIETLSATFGSILATFFAIKYFSAFTLIGCLLIVYSIFYLISFKDSFLFFRDLVFIILILIFSSFLIFFSKRINYSTEKWRIGNFEIKKIIESYYGKILITRQGKSYAFYENGVYLFSIDDEISPQIDVSIPLSQAKKVENILIFGENYRLLSELVKNTNVKFIILVSLDPQIVWEEEVIIKTNYFKHSKVLILFGDVRYYIKKIRKKFDIIISTIPDPLNLQLNKYYTKEFFQLLKNRLSENGVLYFRISSSENFISKPQGMLLGSIYNTLKASFENIIVLPGDSNYFLASISFQNLTTNNKQIYENYKNNGGSSDYFLNYFVPFNFDKFKINSLMNSIDFNTKLNTDLAPITYFYNLKLWSTYFSSDLKNIFFKLYNIKFEIILFILLIIFTILFITLKNRDSLILFSISNIGFIEISLELFVIFIYQIIRGYLYANIGIIYSSFMLGLSLGSFLYTKLKLENKKIFLNIQFIYIFIPLGLYFIYKFVEIINFEFLKDIIFILTVLFFSVLSGLQFPVAVSLYRDEKFAVGRINSFDLIFSSFAALSFSIFFVPLFGFLKLLIILTLIAFFSYIIIKFKF